MSTLDRIMVIATLAAAVWWAVAHRRRPGALAALSVAVFGLSVVALALDGVVWQLVPWQLVAVAACGAAALRHWRPDRSSRWRRAVGRTVLLAGLAAGGVALLTAFVPTLPEPAGPHNVGSVIFRWTDESRAEAFTADSSDRRQVITQAWYPTDTESGRPVPYFEAQGSLPGPVSGLPRFMFASFGDVETHAISGAPISSTQAAWPVLLFSPGLSIPREQYTALCADLASRGFVVVALSVPYESSVAVLASGRIVGQTIHPDVTGPPPHPELERLIGIRAADSRFVLDRLDRLVQLEPGSPIAGHLDLEHIGIVGHSLGGATAVELMAGDQRIEVGVNLDGKLFGREPDARLGRPFLWIQSDATQTAEYTEGRDRFLARQRGSGTLLTVRGSRHLSFTDDPSYLTSLGRRLVGSASGVGSISPAEMTSITADAISAFVAPALGVKAQRRLGEVVADHPRIRSDSRIGREVTVPDASATN